MAEHKYQDGQKFWLPRDILGSDAEEECTIKRAPFHGDMPRYDAKTSYPSGPQRATVVDEDELFRTREDAAWDWKRRHPAKGP